MVRCASSARPFAFGPGAFTWETGSVPSTYLSSYDELNRRLSVVEGIALGEQAVREGRVHAQVEAKRRLSKWLK